MLQSIRNDLLYLLGILNSIAKINKYTEGLASADEFYNANDQLNYNACLNLLTVIGESANKLSETLKEKHSSMEWHKIVSLRNRIVHDYEGIDIFIAYKIVSQSLRIFEEKICKVIEQELLEGNFDKEEFFVAKKSEFYKLVDFQKINV